MTDNTDNEDIGYLAERLRRLFDEVRRPTGKPYSLREVAAGVNAMAGRDLMTFEYLSLIRAGKRKNPSFMVVSALARWFGVDTDYFSCFTQVVPQRGSSALTRSNSDAIAGSGPEPRHRLEGRSAERARGAVHPPRPV